MPRYTLINGKMVMTHPGIVHIRPRARQGEQGATLAAAYRRLEETGQLRQPRGPAALTAEQVKAAIAEPDCPSD